jgi:hypothetical protein
LLRGLAWGSGRGLAWDGGAAAGATASVTTNVAVVFAAEQAFEQLDNRSAIQLVALRLRSFANRLTGLASGLTSIAALLATNLAALHWFAGGFGAAALVGFAASDRVTNRPLGLEHVPDVVEQIADRGSVAALDLATAIVTTSRASRVTGLDLDTRITGLDGTDLLTGGDLGARIALAAATAVQPKHAIQKFKTEPLAAQSYAHKERSKNRLASH